MRSNRSLLGLGRNLGVFLLAMGASFAALAGPSGLSRSGLAMVQDDEVGLLVDHLRGTERLVENPGYRLVLPLLQELHLWRKSPREHILQGNETRHAGHVPQLIVRGHDGSSYWFDRVVIHYAIDPAGLAALHDSIGTDRERIPLLVDAFARTVLRHSFGQFSAEEIASADRRRLALQEAQERMRGHLQRHGLQLLQIVASKPRFLEAYEQTIDRRQVAEQEIARLLQEAERREAGHGERLAQLRRKKALERAESEAALEQELQNDRRDGLVAERRSEIAFADRVRAGTQVRDETLAEADWRIQQARNEARALAEQSRALARHGQPLLRRALARMLGRTSLDFEPRVSLRPSAPLAVSRSIQEGERER